MSISVLHSLTTIEKDSFFKSVAILTDNLEKLVDQFYYHFLNSNDTISDLFSQTDMVKQHNMFRRSIGLILTNLEDQEQYVSHLNSLIKKHITFGVKKEHIPYFTVSFNKTISGILGQNESITRLWHQVIKELMLYFEKELEVLTKL